MMPTAAHFVSMSPSRLSAAVCRATCIRQSVSAMELLGEPVVIRGSTGEKFGDVIHFRCHPPQFLISFHGGHGYRQWVDMLRVLPIDDDYRRSRQSLPVIGDWTPPLPLDEVVRLLDDMNVQRNIKGWPALEHNIVVEYLHIAPGSLTIEIIQQATVDDKVTTFMVAKAVSTMFRIWAKIVPRSPAVCPSCGINVLLEMVEDEIISRLQINMAAAVPVKCVCNQIFVVNRSATGRSLNAGITYFNVSFATRPPLSTINCAEQARDHMCVMRKLHILETALVAKGLFIRNDMWDVIHRLPVSDILNIMSRIEHMDDPLLAIITFTQMSIDIMSAYMAEVPKGFHCVVCGSFQTLDWGWSIVSGRQSGEERHICNLGVAWNERCPTWHNGVTYMNAHVYFDGAMLHHNASFILMPIIYGEADNL